MGNDLSMIPDSTDEVNIGYKDTKDYIKLLDNFAITFEKKTSKATVAVTNYRIYFYKEGKTKKPEKHSHLLLLQSIEVQNENNCILNFKPLPKKKKPITVRFNGKIVELVKTIRTSIRDMTNNIKQNKIIDVIDTGNITSINNIPFSLTPSKALLNTYLAMCNINNEVPSVSHIYYLEKLTKEEIPYFDFFDIPGACDYKSPIAYNISVGLQALLYCEQLTKIVLHDINFPKLDRGLAKFLSANEFIRDITMINLTQSIDFEVFCDVFAESPCNKISIQKCKIDNSHLLGRMCQNRVYSLSKLEITKCSLQKLSESFVAMARNVEFCKHIEYINFYKVSFNDDASKEFAKLVDVMVENGNVMDYLNLGKTNINIPIVMKSISKLTGLKFFNITKAKISKFDDAIEIVNVFKTFKDLTHIIMNSMRMPVNDICLLLSPIGNNDNFTQLSLDLSGNNFGSNDGTVELFKIFPSLSKKIVRLDLSNNKMHGKTANRLMYFMNEFDNLDTLYIGDNPMNTKEAQEFMDTLVEFLKKHPKVSYIKLNGICQSCDKTMLGFIKYLETSKTIVSVDLSNNHFDDYMAQQLCEVIIKNKTLLALNFSDNDFTQEAYISLSYAMAFNNTISYCPYPSKNFANLIKKLPEDYAFRLQETFYSIFQKVKENKKSQGDIDMNMFDTLKYFYMGDKEPILFDKTKVSNLQAKKITSGTNNSKVGSPEISSDE